MASSPSAEYAMLAHHLLAAKYFMLASFVFMVYDHLITLGEEVERVWKQEWTGATWLFLLNRYLTELQFIVNIVSFHDPYWTGKTVYVIQACEDFMPFPGVSTLISIAIAETILMLRIYALYQRNQWILALLVFFWVGQVIVMGTVIRHPTRLELPEGLVGCIQGGEGSYVAAFWLAPLATDSLIFGLTVLKSLEYIYKTKCRVPLIHVIFRDGVLYYAIILSANSLNCFFYYLAPRSIKVIGASFSQIITVVMISRLQLNLRSEWVCSTPRMPTSQLPPLSSPEVREKDKQGYGTLSTVSQYFDATVKDFGKDLVAYEDDGAETMEMIGETRDTPTKCLERVFGRESCVELEMGPIRPVSDGVGTLQTCFTPSELTYVDQVVLISPAVSEERRPIE
ncbi:unnamed protein product [Rhizoctonia solani]|uniref:DUF6533 domain-containing protein n=1 Tax=Rhizoctonia solani TaxID=456999 RepID=A0A8H2XI50_9AGAM|nr:unnamed protein product [Rhizoctonia solani]